MFASRYTATRLVSPVVIVLAIVAVVFITGRAVASVNILSGGDHGEGFNPLPGVYAAEDLVKTQDVGLGTQPSLTVQNVTFDTNAAAIVGGGTLFGTATPTWVMSTTSDANLATVVQFADHLGGAPVPITVSGLTAGTSYQFDLFISTFGGGSRNEGVEFTDSTNHVLLTESVFAVSTAVYGYDVEDAVIAPADGIVKVIAEPGDVPIVNALAVTYMVPEPASLGLLVIGGGVLLGKRRRRVA